MTKHYWGEENFDWDALYKACRFFDVNLKRWARLCVHTKEKYGTMRLEYLGYNEGIYGLIYPGRLWLNYPGPTVTKKPHKSIRKYFPEGHTYQVGLFRVIDDFITAIARKCGLSRLFYRYQRLVFNIITFIAVKKWPHIKDEIMDEYDFKYLLYDWVKKKVNYVCNWKSV